MGGADAPVASDAAWVEELGRLAALVAHEINNLLNGAALNIEVVRSRTAKRADHASIAPHASTAAQQIESLSPIIRGLVALSRPPTAVISTELGHIVSVLHAAAAARRGSVTMDSVDAESETCVSGATARLLLASAVRAAVAPESEVRCSIWVEGQETVVRVARTGSGGVELPRMMEQVAADAGVRADVAGDAILLRFPAAQVHQDH